MAAPARMTHHWRGTPPSTAAASPMYGPCRLWPQTTSAAAATARNSPATGESMLVCSASITTAAVLARARHREPARGRVPAASR